MDIEIGLRMHRGAGAIFMAPLDVVLSRHQVVEPDRLVVAGDQAGYTPGCAIDLRELFRSRS